jgi:endo-1,4-beta-mannosidase
MLGEKEIFINGVNTPWNNWNDFGGNYDTGFWDEEFQRIRQAGGNASRIWISCNGDVGIDIDESGMVSGATESHWEDLDDMLALAKLQGIHIMATLISFDHTKNTNIKYQRWRNLLQDDERINSYIKHYVIPFINRYKDNPYLWCVDICNEIEWMHENSECGNIPWERLQYFAARVATAVHENSSILVTLGSAAVKWNSNCSSCEGNFWSDEYLQAQYSSEGAYLDFYSPHFYGWTVRGFGNFATDMSPDDYGMNDRPCMVGENPASGIYTQNASGRNELVVPISEAYIKTYQNAWKGLMVWTSNGVDGNGSLRDCAPGLTAFYMQYPELVFPASKTSGEEVPRE